MLEGVSVKKQEWIKCWLDSKTELQPSQKLQNSSEGNMDKLQNYSVCHLCFGTVFGVDGKIQPKKGRF